MTRMTSALTRTVTLVVAASVLTTAVVAQPGQVSNPQPGNAATEVSTSTILSWSAATDGRRYDVWFGTSSQPPVVARNLNGTTYQPGALAPGTRYYWQVGARGKGSDITLGPLWSFTTAAAPAPPPAVPSGASPASGATDIAISTAVTWSASSGATAYEVAFGTSSPPPVVSTNHTATTYTPATTLAHATTYYWQITAKGAGGSTPGPLWSFTTAAAPPPPPTLERLRLMTWNVRMGQNLSGAMNVDAQAALMADSGAHVIVLQEVLVSSQTDLRALYESKLEALTGQTWHTVWSPSPRQGTVAEGSLVLSLLPILSSSTLQMDSAPWDATWLDTKRAAVQVAVEVNGVTLNVFGTHLPLDAKHRRTQVDTLLSWIATFPAPRLFGGDFNMVAGSPEHTAMAGALTDIWPVLSPEDQGFTMDSRTSAGGVPGRIDYWWQETTNAEAGIGEVWVIKTSRSDHHALVVDVRVQVK